MSQQILIGNISSGLTQNRTPFNIDNDAFPTLFNAYAWRGRVKRKRGTELLGRLQLQVAGESSGTITTPWTTFIGTTVNPNIAGGSLIVRVNSPITGATQAANAVLTANNNFSAGQSVFVTGVGGMTQLNGNTYAVISANSTTITLNVNSTGFGAYTSGGTATVFATSVVINYVTGAFTATFTPAFVANGTVLISYSYYPLLPVMGLEDFLVFSPSVAAYSNAAQYPLLLAFDTKYSYQVNQQGTVPFFYNTSYYKLTGNPVTWSGQDYEQFWTCNYNGALWATNGNPGMQFELIDTIAVGSPTTINTYSAHGLITGDMVFFSELTGTDANLVNGKTEAITVTSPTSFTVPINTTGKSINNGAGIFQTLTASSPSSVGDGIRWYDGDPTSGTGLYTASGLGWVNFAPPLTASTVSIANQPPGATPYYLVGAVAIVPYKDRLLFFGPYIQLSSGAPIYLPDTVIYSWNGTPYYSNPVPGGETANLEAYFVDQTGFGGWISAGLSQEIVSVGGNEDVLIVGFTNRQTRFAYTGDDILPFLFYYINSEQLGANATFSAVTLDRGVVSIGEKGITLTTQISTERIDLVIPDQVFTINASNNGAQRVNSVRDFLNEWIYFSYPVNTSMWKYPTQTFMYNYRDQTWSILAENYTTRGTFRFQEADQDSWLTIGSGENPYGSWNEWNSPWISGSGNVEFPQVIGGNQQGFVMLSDTGTGEGPSGYIQAFTGISTNTEITSTNHCLDEGDFVLIQNCIGLTGLNNLVGQVQANQSGVAVYDANHFTIDIPLPAGTYLGLGTFARLSVPFIQTKQFNPFWEQGRQMRLGPQKYLFDATANSQVTVNINLSQDSVTVWNATSPNVGPPNSGLEYSQIVYTCPEGTNLGLTPANTNLQMPVATGSGAPQQIWHRMNTALQGDSVQLTITLSDAQMRMPKTSMTPYALQSSAISEVALHAIHITAGLGPLLA